MRYGVHAIRGSSGLGWGDLAGPGLFLHHHHVPHEASGPAVTADAAVADDGVHGSYWRRWSSKEQEGSRVVVPMQVSLWHRDRFGGMPAGREQVEEAVHLSSSHN